MILQNVMQSVMQFIVWIKGQSVDLLFGEISMVDLFRPSHIELDFDYIVPWLMTGTYIRHIRCT